jgi:hypothetical protein
MAYLIAYSVLFSTIISNGDLADYYGLNSPAICLIVRLLRYLKKAFLKIPKESVIASVSISSTYSLKVSSQSASRLGRMICLVFHFSSERTWW